MTADAVLWTYSLAPDVAVYSTQGSAFLDSHATKRDFPERGLVSYLCIIELSALPGEYIGGRLTTNSMNSSKFLGTETEPGGYTQVSIATIRLWKSECSDPTGRRGQLGKCPVCSARQPRPSHYFIGGKEEMKQACLGLAIAAGLTLPAFPFGAWAQSCAPGPATMQILGSGGPVASRERASSSYLLWVGGEARMLIDAGGGAYLRFGQSRAKLTDLALVAISHLHPDHVSDLPALLWMSRIPIDLGGQSRNEPLAIVGPSGNDEAPDFATFVARLFEKGGALQVLGTILNASAQGRTMRLLSVSVVDVGKPEPSTVFKNRGTSP